MNHQVRSRLRIGGLLGAVGGVLVIVGTYWMSWFSLKGYNGHSFGGSTLYHLQTFVTAGWYSYASQVMVVGAIFLLVSGIVAMVLTDSKVWELCCAVGMALGAAIVLFASLKTGLPHWFTIEPLYFTRGVGEWVCISGAVLGFVGGVMAWWSTLIAEPVHVAEDQDSLTPVS